MMRRNLLWLSIALLTACGGTKVDSDTETGTTNGTTDSATDAPDCQVIYDGCNDPCTPLCLDMSGVTSSQYNCDLGCSGTTQYPPGECVQVGDACEWETPM